MSLDKGKMPKKIDVSQYRYAIVASRFNKKYVDALVKDAVKTFNEHGVDSKNIKLVRVPGAGEVPHVCNMLAETCQYDAVIALGVVIAGDTPHHLIIAHSTANALQQIAVSTTVPMINGLHVCRVFSGGRWKSRTEHHIPHHFRRHQYQQYRAQPVCTPTALHSPI